MATLFMGVKRRDKCDNVIGTGKRAYAGPQVHSNTMNPPAPCETGTGTPKVANSACWGGTGSNANTAI